MHAMPEGIDYGVIDDTAARGNGSFSRSTRALELEHRLLKFDRRFVNADGMCAQVTYDIIANIMLCNF